MAKRKYGEWDEEDMERAIQKLLTETEIWDLINVAGSTENRNQHLGAI